MTSSPWAQAHDGTIVGLQYARGIAALLVVMDHCASLMAASPKIGRSPAAFLEYGYIGVPIFFIISGFVITMVALDRNLTARVSLAHFAEKRFVRIVPFMWVCIIGYNALSLAGTGVVEWGPFLRALSLWPSGEVKPNVIWTLRHEALFYIVFGLTMLLPKRVSAVLALWVAAPLIIGIFFPHFRDVLTSRSPTDPTPWSLLFSDANLLFGLGMAIGLWRLRHPGFLMAELPGGAMAAFAAAAAMLLAVAALGWRSGTIAQIGVSLLSLVLVTFCIAIRPSPNARMTGLALLLGDASYSIYLVHNAVLLVLLAAVSGMTSRIGLWAVYSICVVSAVIGGVAVHLLVERRLIRLVGKWMPRRGRPSMAHPDQTG